jgi:pimeloyl-ACP methyl ester carboxylesterase
LEKYRKYGLPPFCVVVVHGGPGAAGEMAPVARELSPQFGIIEPLQTANTMGGQIKELNDTLENNGEPPFTVVGFSWGAWLSFLLASFYPRIVKKLILVASGPFEKKYADNILNIRLARLERKVKKAFLSLTSKLETGSQSVNEYQYLLELLKIVDAYDPLPDSEETMFNHKLYKRIWAEAIKLRGSGELLCLGKKIICPVVAIHGDYDPHPAIGVSEPLSQVIKDFRFILLEKCGHRPWLERWARTKFYSTLIAEVDN